MTRTRIGSFVLAGLLLCPAAALAVRPEGSQPGALERQRLIGREQKGNTFRKPGTLLAEADSPHSQVDLDELRRRKIEQVSRRRRVTHRLATRGGPAGAGDGDADLDEPEVDEPADGAPADDAPASASSWMVVLFVVGTAAALLIVLRLAGKRR